MAAELKGLEREETEVVRVLSTLRSPSHDRIKLPPKPHNPLKAFFWWYLSWAVPGESSVVIQVQITSWQGWIAVVPVLGHPG